MNEDFSESLSKLIDETLQLDPSPSSSSSSSSSSLPIELDSQTKGEDGLQEEDIKDIKEKNNFASSSVLHPIIYEGYPLNDELETSVQSYESIILNLNKEINDLRLENKKLKKVILVQKDKISELKECNQVLSTNLASLFQTASLEISRLKGESQRV